MTGADGTYTVNWKLSFVADCIDVRRIDYYDASGEPCGWSEPPIVDNATSCTVTLPEDKDSADYIVIVFRKDDGGGLKKVCESTFTVERFRFTQQPGRYYDDETSTYIEDENIAPVYGEFAPFWKLSAEAYKQQLIYYPVSDPDNKTVVELDGDNEYPITSTNKWEDYEGFVRAWYGTGEDEYIDSMTFTIHMQGPGLRIELNGGSYGLTVKNGENGFDRTEYIQYEEAKNIVFPECMLTPPEGMMFDCWVLTDPKSYFMAMENVNTQTSEELPPDVIQNLTPCNLPHSCSDLESFDFAGSDQTHKGRSADTQNVTGFFEGQELNMIIHVKTPLSLLKVFSLVCNIYRHFHLAR